MENKVKIELTEDQLNNLIECCMMFNDLKFNGFNAKIAYIQTILTTAKNLLIDARIKNLENEMRKLEKQKYVQKETNQETNKNVEQVSQVTK